MYPSKTTIPMATVIFKDLKYNLFTCATLDVCNFAKAGKIEAKNAEGITVTASKNLYAAPYIPVSKLPFMYESITVSILKYISPKIPSIP